MQKISLAICFFLCAAFYALQETQAQCPAGWNQFRNQPICYVNIDPSLSWRQARRICSSKVPRGKLVETTKYLKNRRTMRSCEIKIELLPTFDPANIFAASDSSGNVLFWDRTTFQLIKRIKFNNPVRLLTLNGNNFLFGWDSSDIQVGSWVTLTTKGQKFSLDSSSLYNFALISANATHIIFASNHQNGLTKIWQYDTTQIETQSPTLVISLNNTELVSGLEYLGDDLLAVGGNTNIRIWNIRTAFLISTITQPSATSIKLKQDDNTMLTTNYFSPWGILAYNTDTYILDEYQLPNITTVNSLYQYRDSHFAVSSMLGFFDYTIGLEPVPINTRNFYIAEGRAIGEYMLLMGSNSSILELWNMTRLENAHVSYNFTGLSGNIISIETPEKFDATFDD